MEKKTICLLMFLGLSVIPAFGLMTVNSGEIIFGSAVFESDKYWGWLKAYGSSEVVLNHGSFGLLYMYDQSQFYMNGGTLDSIAPVSFRTYDESKVFQYGGNISMFTLLDNSEGYFYGGDLDCLRVYDNSKAFVYSEIEHLEAWGLNSEVHLYGYAFQYTENNKETNPPKASGYTYSNLRVYTDSSLMDYYDIKLMDHLPTTTSPWEWRAINQVVLHHIPEPTTLALLGLGGLLIRKRKC